MPTNHNFPNKERNNAYDNAKRPDSQVTGRRVAGEFGNVLGALTAQLPDARLPVVVRMMVQGIVASESPLVTQIARGARESGQGVLMTSKRGYRLLVNERLSYRLFLKGCTASRSARWRGRPLG